MACLLGHIPVNAQPTRMDSSSDQKRFSQPLLLAAWGERWRMQGATPEEVKAKLGKILQGADPPHSEEAIATLLADGGFEPPLRFFSSLFWGAWIARRAA